MMYSKACRKEKTGMESNFVRIHRCSENVLLDLVHFHRRSQQVLLDNIKWHSPTELSMLLVKVLTQLLIRFTFEVSWL